MKKSSRYCKYESCQHLLFMLSTCGMRRCKIYIMKTNACSSTCLAALCTWTVTGIQSSDEVMIDLVRTPEALIYTPILFTSCLVLVCHSSQFLSLHLQTTSVQMDTVISETDRKKETTFLDSLELLETLILFFSVTFVLLSVSWQFDYLVSFL